MLPPEKGGFVRRTGVGALWPCGGPKARYEIHVLLHERHTDIPLSPYRNVGSEIFCILGFWGGMMEKNMETTVMGYVRFRGNDLQHSMALRTV